MGEGRAEELQNRSGGCAPQNLGRRRVEGEVAEENDRVLLREERVESFAEWTMSRAFGESDGMVFNGLPFCQVDESGMERSRLDISSTS